MCEQVVVALHHVKLYVDKMTDVREHAKLPAQCVTCGMAMSFIDDDQLHGSKPNNCLLLVIGHILGQKVKHILVDGNAIINIMHKSTMNDLEITVNIMHKSIMNGLEITVKELSKSRMMIQPFNLEGQQMNNMIRLELIMGNLSITSIFLVIDLKTS